MKRYVENAASDVRSAEKIAESLTAVYEHSVDSVYFGGGTPSLLDPLHFVSLMDSVRDSFDLIRPEVTVEVAPNSISEQMLSVMLAAGVNRISFGAQSFVDTETRAVARLHGASDTVRDIKRVQQAGLENISVDLIAGLPHQTIDSWHYSLDQIIDLGVPHVSIYMLEVDEESRLGREMIAGGTRYHAHSVPHEDAVATMYEHAIERLARAGIEQYEISNFAIPGFESRHNLKYWQRDPYFGFGADAHSMLRSFGDGGGVRFATQEGFADFDVADDHYCGPVQHLNREDAIEEAMILGLRLNRGVDLDAVRERYGSDPMQLFSSELEELIEAEMLQLKGNTLKLTDRGRLLSNEVFEKFVI